MYLYAAAVMWICSKFCSCLTVPLIASWSSKTILKFIYDVRSWIWSLSCDWVTCALNPMYLWSETNHVPKARSSHITLPCTSVVRQKHFPLLGIEPVGVNVLKHFARNLDQSLHLGLLPRLKRYLWWPITTKNWRCMWGNMSCLFI